MSGERCTSGSDSALPARDHLAHRLGARVGFAAGGLRLRQLGGDVAELLLVEAGVVRAALEDVGLGAEVLDLGLGFGDLLDELVDLRLQRLLHVVGLGERCASASIVR